MDAVTVRRWELGMFSPSPMNLDRAASVYGVAVADLLQSASSVPYGNLVEMVPVKGYIEAGNHRDCYEIDLGMIHFPRMVLLEHPRAFSLIASGDSLEPDGIHNGDILIIDPELSSRTGSMCIARIDGTLCATMYVSSSLLKLRTRSGKSEDLDASKIEVIGNVVWHLRKMG